MARAFGRAIVARLARPTRASPSVKQSQALTNCGAIRLGTDSGSGHRYAGTSGGQGCGLQNYNRSSLRHQWPLTLMKDALGDSIR